MPDPFFVCVGGFFCDGAGQVDGSKPVLQVFLMGEFYLLDVKAEGLVEAVGEDGEAVVFPLAVADDDLTVVKVDIFYAQAHGFHDAQPSAVHDLGDEFGCAGEGCDEAFYFFFGEDGWDAFCALGAVGGEGGFV